jgi:periplasmic divalent cation tolerance protein
MTDKRIALTTCSSLEEARKIAHALVERKLAACVNIVPGVESVYRWKAAVETASEYLLIVKTTANAFSSLRAALGELHSYEVPECIEIAITDGSEDYFKWFEESMI